MVYTIEQWHDDTIAQFLRCDSAKCRLERCCLDGDPDDIKVSIEPVGDLHRCLEGPERLTLDTQPLGIVIPAAGPHEQGHRMTSLCERAAHETADPTRSEYRMSHRPPPSTLCAPFYTATARPGGVTDANSGMHRSWFVNQRSACGGKRWRYWHPMRRRQTDDESGASHIPSIRLI